MFTEPKLEHRKALHAVAIRTQTPMQELGTVIPQLHDEVAGWLNAHGLSPAGAPFLRFLVIDMEGLFDIELGFPVETAPAGEGRINTAILPEGTYATLIYTGIHNGIPANAALMEWASEQGIVWKTSQTPDGQEQWAGRVEFYLTDSDTEPDMDKCQTEVAILIAEA